MNRRENWENDSLDRFLEALSAWVNDSEGYYLNLGEPVPTQPSWQMIEDMFMAASSSTMPILCGLGCFAIE